MILKGSQRGGARQLAAHLLNDRDNDHVTVEELRGFVADDLSGAMAEAHAIARGTRCRQPVFSLSLSPPKDAMLTVDDLRAAADRAETALGLEGQPRAIVIHEKDGRRHAHVVWSRIDADEMKAVNLPFYKNRLSELSKQLYLDHGWELPEGHRTNGWKNPLNFTLAEWQQAKRVDLDPKELKQLFGDAWRQADGPKAFAAALEERGYYLARGDRRGVVALDTNGEVFSVSRMCGVKAKELEARIDPARLKSVDDVRMNIQTMMTGKVREHIAQDRQEKRNELKPLAEERRRMVSAQRAERARLLEGQAQRLERETKDRADRFRKGFAKVFDVLTGRAAVTRRQNEKEAFEGYRRDRAQRETLFDAQQKERRDLQTRLSATLARHRAERMELVAQFARVWRDIERIKEARTPVRTRGHDPEP